MIRNPPYYGRGIAFPFRINPATGGVQISEGSSDAESVALQHLADRFTIPEPAVIQGNHISEAIAHILLTVRGEHDTLPEFGSDVHYLLFDPNAEETRLIAEHYFCSAAKRWEKRVRIDEPDGVDWNVSDYSTDLGRLGCILRPEFIRNQAPGNLVAPLVSAREARLAEYPSGDVDAQGHDYESRYHGDQPTVTDGIRHLRLGIRHRPYPPVSDDEYYEVPPTAPSWLTISHTLYGDHRYWWVIAEMAAQDAAENGEARTILDTAADPEPGTLLRVPSRKRLLMEIAA